MKEKIHSIIEITDTHIKFLQAQKQKDEISLVRRIVRERPDAGESMINPALLQDIPVKDIEDHEVTIVIPRRLVVVKQLELPSVQEQEIRRMIELQITNHVPYPRERIIFDFQIINKEKAGYAQVLVVIAHKDLIDQYLAVVQKAGLYTHRLLVSSFCLLGWYQKYKQEESGGPVMFVYCDGTAVEVCFIQGDKLLFSRQIVLGSRDLAKARPRLMEQLDLTISAYHKQGVGADIEKIAVAADGESGDVLQNDLNERYRIPVDILSLGEDPEYKDVAIFGAADAHINLIPEEVLDTKKFRVRRKEFVKAFIMAFIACCLAFGIWGVDIVRDMTYLRELDYQLEGLKPEVQAVKEQMQLISVAREEKQKRVFIPDIVRELYILTPQDISFQSVQVNQNGMLTIQGFDKSGVAVNQLQKGLMDSEFFSDVTLQYATKRKRFNQEYTDFRINCQLSPGEDKNVEEG